MRRNFILSESEIRQLVKKTLLKEEPTNKTIQDLQTLLASKGFTEVGTADNKAGQNTLSALNRALGLGLTMYRPQTNQPKNIVRSPSTVDSEKNNAPSPDGKAATNQLNKVGDPGVVPGADAITNNVIAPKDAQSFSTIKK